MGLTVVAREETSWVAGTGLPMGWGVVGWAIRAWEGPD